MGGILGKGVFGTTYRDELSDVPIMALAILMS